MENKNNNQPVLSLQEQTKIRMEKIDKLKEKGVEPFGKRFEVKDKICDIKKNYTDKIRRKCNICNCCWKNNYKKRYG